MQLSGRLVAAGRFIAGCLSALTTGFLVTGLLFGVPYLTLTPLLDDFSLAALDPPNNRTLILLDRDDKPFARRGGCVAEPVKYAEIPKHFVDALVSMEDRRFFMHPGIDPIGLLRAAQANRAAGHIVQGGSTLTQQLIKNAYLSSERTFERKEKEAWMALALELRLSKEEIFERYVSSAYFGEGCFGLRAAAKRYFNTPVSKLTVPQSAYLVALLKSPTGLRQDPEKAKERANLVMEAMVETHALGIKERDKLKPVLPEIASTSSDGGYYADWVASTIRLPKDGSYAPVRVHTTFDPKLQKLAEHAVDSVLSKQGESRKASQAAMVVMRTDGRVLAMVGGTNYDESQFNRAVQAARQPGSSFKLFVYLAGLRAGLTPESTLVDQPIKIGNYEPKNFGHRFRGPVSMRQAFASSINTVAVQISEAVGRKPVIDAARDLGVTAKLQATPSIALGVYEVPLLEMTSAYAAAASGAYPVKRGALPASARRMTISFRPKAPANGGWSSRTSSGSFCAPTSPAAPVMAPGSRSQRTARPAPARIIAMPGSSALPAIWSSASGSAMTTFRR
ncbi:Penicillin-binding protein 2D [Methyloligella halotolerans]|uniref:peptidoglycan glycosyltransferase n=1 Tax=Methyloligella halotolerans TaxID=1177755 RepID=A0A1E2RWQ5_9HYPH|nr:transglycosylase domain-containing protein [Methyloligella halotolerans]ODA66696.1 Penicillin-binding protein 2D [Methyloligella halotolerans]